MKNSLNVGNRRVYVVAVVVLILALLGAGFIGTSLSSPSYEVNEQHRLVYSPVDDKVDRNLIYVDDGVVCTDAAADGTSDPSECRYAPEEALQKLQHLGFYDDHPNAPRPPVDEPAA